ncbi:DUF2911 domain-containing protein [Algoriphagus aestuariicola]|uniref:DUF2911 domain-containing protein n=1 Tax=Algoriphagus aestuariicola TaxID=1852016 RepID=A0ABS3BWN5_9BACT|nr:DUF2911 domain-containing protein [Algoriphagus aestuariicola]MBN7803266.1 DUF2911 domain-containing protein [Algoriphagus aestuariicola]
MKNTKSLLLAFTLFITSSFAAMAQLQAPAASPSAFVSQNVGFTKISISYSSPGVKGRKIFGELHKYGETWRAGANNQTIIEFSTGVSVGGKNLPAGKYSIFITPAATGEWTIHLNKKAESVYAYTKDGKIDEAAVAADDAVAVKSAPKMGENTERLIYTISAENNKVATVTMAWEKVSVSFQVDTQADQKIEQFKSQF